MRMSSWSRARHLLGCAAQSGGFLTGANVLGVALPKIAQTGGDENNDNKRQKTMMGGILPVGAAAAPPKRKVPPPKPVFENPVLFKPPTPDAVIRDGEKKEDPLGPAIYQRMKEFCKYT